MDATPPPQEPNMHMLPPLSWFSDYVSQPGEAWREGR